jgi:hypothetical protein
MRPLFFFAAVSTIAGICTATSAGAANRYDGTWSVSLVADQGECNAAYSWNVAVSDGRIGDNNFFIQFAGFVDRKGKVILKASHGTSMLVASGTINGTNGSGTWLSPNNRCSGQWHATRASS